MDFLLPTIAFIEGLGGPEMVLIFVIVLVLFGGEKLPDFARGLGKSIREFKKAASGVEEEFKRALEEDAQKKSTPTPALTVYPAYPPTSTTPALEAPPHVEVVTSTPVSSPAIESIGAAETPSLETPPAATDAALNPITPAVTPLPVVPPKTDSPAAGLSEHLP